MKLIFILGIDGLEYNLVEKLKLDNLKQLEYGKINVPINREIGLPVSPEVWASFLTGEHISITFKTNSSLRNAILWIGDIINVDFTRGIFRKIKNYLKKLGYKSASQRFGGLKQKTFLDVTNSKEINVPFYNHDHAGFDAIHLFGENKITLQQLIKEIKSIYTNRKKQILTELENLENIDVIFAYMNPTDHLQHISYDHISQIKRHYIDLDDYIQELKKILENECETLVFFIISDHGFDIQTGNHSQHGFYSSNVRSKKKPTSITDFYGIILDIARMHARAISF